MLEKLLAMSVCTWGNTRGLPALTYRPREVQLRCDRSMTSSIKYTAMLLYKYRPAENRSHFKFSIFCIYGLVERHTFPHTLHSNSMPSEWQEFCLLKHLNPELNPICYLLALLGAHHFLHFSRIRVKLLTFRLLMSYIYGAPILDVSRSHTTTQHSR